MHDLVARLLSKNRKRWFKTRPLFEFHEPVGAFSFAQIEKSVGASIPDDMKEWLLAVGFGDVDETLSFRQEWFSRVAFGHRKSAVFFAQDDLGNFYGYSLDVGDILFFSRSSQEAAVAAPSFRAFMEELERRDFRLHEWMDSLAGEPCLWDDQPVAGGGPPTAEPHKS